MTMQALGMVQQVLGLARRRLESNLTNAELLTRFVAGKDEDSFAQLMRRHGPMVWGVCSRTLRCPHDAADAFQATFLVLARRAETVSPRERVGFWLYGVARQTALRTRLLASKRHAREKQLDDHDEPVATSVEDNDLKSMLDVTLSGLPAKYRLPIVLCDLEERTHRDVALQLGWPIGTVAGRLVRGRKLLASRLARHGVTIPSLGLSALAAQGAPMPYGLLKETAEAASQFAICPAAGVISATTAAGLAQGVMNAMFLTKCKVAAGVMVTLALSVLALGSVGWAKAGAMEPTLAAVVDDQPKHAPQQHQFLHQHQHEHATPVGSNKAKEDTPLRKLREEKLKVLTTAMHEVHKQREKGNATFMDAAQSHHLVCKAEFDLATTDADRMKALTKQVKWAKQIEESAKKLNEEGKFPILDLYKVTTDRIDAEIALEKVKMAMHGERK